MTGSIADRLIDYLAGKRGEMTELLQRLVATESPSTSTTAAWPVFEILEASLDQRGFAARHLPGRTSAGMLFARPVDRVRHQPSQLLLGHADTVWPTGTLQTMPLAVEGDRLRGPGSYDMKGGLVQGIYAIEALQQLGCPMPVAPLFFVNSDEEIGSRESTPWVRRLGRIVDRVFVLEPSLGPEGRLKTARKGIGRFTVTVEGKAAHAGLDPDKGASAILELSHVIQSLFQLNDPERGVTVNVGTIDGGLNPNVIAPKSRAVVDVRVPTHRDAQRIETAIHALQAITPGTTLTIEGQIGRPPMERSPGNRRLWQVAREAAVELGLDIDEASVGGGSDGNTTSQFAPTLDGLGAVGDGAHAPNEFLYLDKMIERTALLALLISRDALRETGPNPHAYPD